MALLKLVSTASILHSAHHPKRELFCVMLPLIFLPQPQPLVPFLLLPGYLVCHHSMSSTGWAQAFPLIHCWVISSLSGPVVYDQMCVCVLHLSITN